MKNKSASAWSAAKSEEHFGFKRWGSGHYSVDADGFVKKVAFIYLTKIANPKHLAKRGPNEDNFVLPHLGPEGLTLVDATHIVVVNDNNFPYSSGRTLGQPDDNELTLLNIQTLVEAK